MKFSHSSVPYSYLYHPAKVFIDVVNYFNLLKKNIFYSLSASYNNKQYAKIYQSPFSHMSVGQLAIMNDCGFLRQYARLHFPRDNLAPSPPPQSVHEMV